MAERWAPSPAIRGSVALHAAAALGVAAMPAAWPWGVAAVAGNHLLLTAAGLWPRSTLLGPNLRRLPERNARLGQVGLCFDDGPDPAVTPAVLELLDRYGAKASFFCIGERASRHPGLVRDIVAGGHTVENHTWRHSPAFSTFGVRAIRREVVKAQAPDRGAFRQAAPVLQGSGRSAQPAAGTRSVPRRTAADHLDAARFRYGLAKPGGCGGPPDARPRRRRPADAP